MRQVRIRTNPRIRRTIPADPPTMSREITRIWFPESEESAS
jgi:hypothetical protein